MKRLLPLPLLFLLSCDGGTQRDEAWLRGDTETRLAVVAKQLRGLDVTMVEVGYRYGELYWAGQDQNWPYAAYQIEKIRTAVALGLERRPKRAASAAVLESALTPLAAAVQRRDQAEFTARFAQLTATCNACHHAEAVPFMHVVTPTERRSSIRTPEAAR
jgi:hypothetical protein